MPIASELYLNTIRDLAHLPSFVMQTKASQSEVHRIAYLPVSPSETVKCLFSGPWSKPIVSFVGSEVCVAPPPPGTPLGKLNGAQGETRTRMLLRHRLLSSHLAHPVIAILEGDTRHWMDEKCLVC